jgi:hypothetical protein
VPLPRTARQHGAADYARKLARFPADGDVQH